MRRYLLAACAAATAMVPGAVAWAHSIQSPNLPDGRLNTKNGGYIDVEYNRKQKKLGYIQVYYACRAAGPANSKYPAYLSLTTDPRVPLHSGRASGSFNYKITESFDSQAVGDTATVAWSVSGVKLSTAGLSGTLNVSVSGPPATCPFSLKNKHLTPLNDLQGQQGQ
jgi:hypothetical protein